MAAGRLCAVQCIQDRSRAAAQYLSAACGRGADRGTESAALLRGDVSEPVPAGRDRRGWVQDFCIESAAERAGQEAGAGDAGGSGERVVVLVAVAVRVGALGGVAVARSLAPKRGGNMRLGHHCFDFYWPSLHCTVS